MMNRPMVEDDRVVHVVRVPVRRGSFLELRNLGVEEGNS